MRITSESHGHAVILNLHGELTEDSLAAFAEAAEQQLADPDVIDIVLNFESVPFIDSVSLEYLLDLQDRLAEKLGRVKLVKPGQDLCTILEMTRLADTFEVFRDVPEAVKVLET